MAREQRLAEVFVELADTLVDGFDVIDFLHVLTERCVELIDADAAGLMLVDQEGSLQAVAYTHESARLLELLELQRDEGPCLECFATGETIANVHLTEASDKWPTFGEAARGVGFLMSHAVPLRLRDQVLGALNLFAVSPTPLSADHLAVARGLADIATIGLLHERAVQDQKLLSDQLQTALDSRIVIEQAKGILSAQAGATVAVAFRRMRAHARRTGMPLTTVAKEVIAGSLDAAQLQGAPGSAA